MRAIPKGFANPRFIFIEAGQEIASLKTSSWSEKADLSVDGKQLRLYREKMFSGRFIMEHDGREIASATKPSAFKERFVLDLAGRPVEITKEGFLGKSFQVSGETEGFGRIEREGWFTSKTIVDLPSDWPVAVRVFAFWLVHLLWRRMESAGM